MSFYHRNLARQQQQVAQWLQKRRQENAQRRLAGEEALPEEDPVLFKPPPEPSPLDGFLIVSQAGSPSHGPVWEEAHMALHVRIPLEPLPEPGPLAASFSSARQVLACFYVRQAQPQFHIARLGALDFGGVPCQPAWFGIRNLGIGCRHIGDFNGLWSIVQVDTYCEQLNRLAAQSLERLYVVDSLQRACGLGAPA